MTTLLHRARILAWLARDASGFFEWLGTRPWYREILSDWVAAIPLNADDRVLEVGCGPGLLSAQVAKQGVTITGLDRSPAMVRRARENFPEYTFIEGDALSLPLDDDAMDVAFAASVVNIVDAPQKLVSEMARVVRPGGFVSVLFPTPRLADDASEVAKQRGIVGLSGAALSVWGSKAPKRESNAVRALFEECGLLDIRLDRYFHGTIASVTGIVANRSDSRAACLGNTSS